MLRGSLLRRENALLTGLSVHMIDPLQKDFKLKGLLALNLAQTAAALNGLLGSSSQKRQPHHGVAHPEVGLPTLLSHGPSVSLGSCPLTISILQGWSSDLVGLTEGEARAHFGALGLAF